MRFRPLALFALAAGFAVMVGDFTGARRAREDQARRTKEARPAAAGKGPAGRSRRQARGQAGRSTLADAHHEGRRGAGEGHRRRSEPQARRGEDHRVGPRCSDEEFLRRVYLDITGVIPTAEKAKAFLDSKDAGQAGQADRRTARRPELRPAHGRHLDREAASRATRDNRFVLKDPLVQVARGAVQRQHAWDKIVTNLVTATGDRRREPRGHLLPGQPLGRQDHRHVTQHFLGIQLQCAQCHNHPFTDWKQTEYWGMAAFFSKVQADNPQEREQGRRQHADRRDRGQRPHAAEGLPPRVGQDRAAEVPRRRRAEAERERAVPPGAGGVDDRRRRTRTSPRRWSTAPGRSSSAAASSTRSTTCTTRTTPSHPELLDALAPAVRRPAGST